MTRKLVHPGLSRCRACSLGLCVVCCKAHGQAVNLTKDICSVKMHNCSLSDSTPMVTMPVLVQGLRV